MTRPTNKEIMQHWRPETLKEVIDPAEQNLIEVERAMKQKRLDPGRLKTMEDHLEFAISIDPNGKAAIEMKREVDLIKQAIAVEDKRWRDKN